jgi:hypothetical protein
MYQMQGVNLPNGERATVVTGGVILSIRDVDRVGQVDIEADRLVIWDRGGNAQQLFNNINRPEGHTGQHIEVYLAGHVEFREQERPGAGPAPAPRPPAAALPATAPTSPTTPAEGQSPVVRGQVPDGTPLPTPGSPPLPGTPAKDASGVTPATGPRPDAPVKPATNPGKGPVTHILRCDEVYYDVSRNVALALNGDLEIRQTGFPDPVHFRGVEIQQLSPTQFRAITAKVFSSKLPSDPGLYATFDHADLEEQKVVKRGLFGTPVIDRATGQPVIEERDMVTAGDVFFFIEQFPFFYVPWARFDAHDPLGPLQDLSIGYNTIFGFQLGLNFNMYDLIGLQPLPGTRWQLQTDYLSNRGPALGTIFDASSPDFFGMEGKSTTYIKAWGIDDHGTDNLGGGRGPLDHHPDLRGWFLFRENVQDLPYGFSGQAQLSALSDKNFLEQYYKPIFDNDPNQETFLYLKQQQDNWAWTILTEPRIRNWVTETQWLPRADVFLIGQPIFDRLVYNSWASAGYGHLEITHLPPPPVCPTDVSVGTGRFDLTQELSLPFYAGPVKVVPYGTLDLTYYTADIHDQDVGRVIGGGGVRASIPFTRLYPDVQSDWFNLNAINHKIVVSGNYYVAQSNVAFNSLSQFDQVNDNATDQALRDIKPLEPLYNPAAGVALATSPLYDPQLYAIRRLVDNRIDTRDDIEVVELDVRQRLQTKRGYPGMQHTVDWMTLDVSATVFPDSHRDDFGHPLGFIDYDFLWNVGDRNGFVSNGWFEPFSGGARVWNVGAFFDRTDRTSLYLGYRQIDPLDSRLVIASLITVLSPKYALTASTAYDFGTSQAQSNTLMLTRMGSDLQVSLGFTYNAITNSFGFLFEIIPNAVAQSHRGSTMQAIGPGSGLLGAH